MKKFDRSKIALFLACMSVLGNSTSAMNANKVQNPQTIGTVGGARNQPKKINLGKIAKIGGFTVAGLAALETIHSLIGGLTDSKLGSYSIGRAIRNRVKKNEQPDSGKPDDAMQKNLVVFDQKIYNELDSNHGGILAIALNTINEKCSEISEVNELTLKDLLHVIKSNQINEKDAETIVIDNSSNNVKISVTLNSVVYCLELSGSGVFIYKDGEMITILKYSKPLAFFEKD